jgi:hypothetical protein
MNIRVFFIICLLELPLIPIMLPFRGDDNLIFGISLIWQFFILGLLYLVRELIVDFLKELRQAGEP